MSRTRPTAYDRGQHQLICDALKVSNDPDAPGPTAYEAVCLLLYKLKVADEALAKSKGKAALSALQVVRSHHDDFDMLPMY